MAELPGQMPAAAGRGDLRASHADREETIGILTAAFVQGRLAKDEFDLRVGQALVSRTYGELAAVTADLPEDLSSAQPPEPALPPVKRPIVRPGRVLVGTTAVYAGMWPLAMAVASGNSENNAKDGLNLIASATLIYILVVILIALWAQALGSRREKHSGGQLRGGSAPGAGGQAPQRLPSADPGSQLPPIDPRRRHTAEAARRRLPRPRLVSHLVYALQHPVVDASGHREPGIGAIAGGLARRSWRRVGGERC